MKDCKHKTGNIKAIILVKIPTKYMIKKYGIQLAWEKEIGIALKRNERYL